MPLYRLLLRLQGSQLRGEVDTCIADLPYTICGGGQEL